MSKLFPNKEVKSVYELDIDFFTENDIKGVIFDIDNTLVTHTTVTPPEELLNYLKNIENNGIKIAIVSNNKRERVELFSKSLGYVYHWRAYKPFKKYLNKVQKHFNLPSENIALVGDQIFTDIYGANRMGFYSVLVTQLGENETGFVAFKRIFEKMVINRYKNLSK